jgi:LuxR family transcriptional regulator, quorum-sensing system regulator SolR
MLTGSPANFESVDVDSVVNDWLFQLKNYAVQGLLVLGPDPYGESDARKILVAHPPNVVGAAQLLVSSKDFFSNGSAQDPRPVTWQAVSSSIDADADHWRGLLFAKGFRSFVRVAFPLPNDCAFECYAFSSRTWLTQDEPAQVAWHTWNAWPRLKKSLANAYCPLSPREAQSLRLAFDGLTARAAAQAMGCSERTVVFHITNAMNKLKVDNKLAAVQRAIFIGCI